MAKKSEIHIDVLLVENADRSWLNYNNSSINKQKYSNPRNIHVEQKMFLSLSLCFWVLVLHSNCMQYLHSRLHYVSELVMPSWCMQQILYEECKQLLFGFSISGHIFPEYTHTNKRTHSVHIECFLCQYYWNYSNHTIHKPTLIQQIK